MRMELVLPPPGCHISGETPNIAIFSLHKMIASLTFWVFLRLLLSSLLESWLLAWVRFTCMV